MINGQRRRQRPSFFGWFLTPNRRNSRIYFGQLYNQLIVDPTTGYASKESYIVNFHEGSADFSYKEKEGEIIYFFDNEALRILNLAAQETEFRYAVQYGMRGTTTTTDGKYLILYNPLSIGRDNEKDHSTIFQFSIDEILKY